MFYMIKPKCLLALVLFKIKRTMTRKLYKYENGKVFAYFTPCRGMVGKMPMI